MTSLFYRFLQAKKNPHELLNTFWGIELGWRVILYYYMPMIWTMFSKYKNGRILYAYYMPMMWTMFTEYKNGCILYAHVQDCYRYGLSLDKKHVIELPCPI